MWSSWLYNVVLDKALGGFGSVTLLLLVYAVALLFIFTRDIAQVMDNLLHAFQVWRQRRKTVSSATVAMPPPRPPATIPAAMPPSPVRKPEAAIPAQGIFPLGAGFQADSQSDREIGGETRPEACGENRGTKAACRAEASRPAPRLSHR